MVWDAGDLIFTPALPGLVGCKLKGISGGEVHAMSVATVLNEQALQYIGFDYLSTSHLYNNA